MGLDPGDTDFECGDDCATCNPELWTDCTPKTVWANISGLKACPAWLGFVPNGTWKMTQTVGDHCIWEGVHNNLLFRWVAKAPTAFSVSDFGPPLAVYFLAGLAGKCSDEFDNEAVCPVSRCFDGHCTITWGPESPCE